MTRWLVIIGLAVSPISCSSEAFFCTEDGQCVQREAQGTCQVSGVCSFPDSDCDSGHRFGEFAGALANTCVPENSGPSSGAEPTSVSDAASPGETSAADTLGAADDDTTETTVSTTESTSVDPDGGQSSGSSSSGGANDSSTGGSATGTTGSQGLPDGSECAVASDCASGHCATQGALRSICSECTTDADCEWGCGPPNPFSRPVAPGQCGDGTLGAACEANESCGDELTCLVFLDVPGIGAFAGCGECGPGLSCPEGQVCNVNLDLPDAAGHHECVSPGSVPNGGSCTLGAGVEACDMFCESVQIEGLVAVGICGECLSNDDCQGAEICISGSVQFPGGSLVPSTCS